MDKRKREILALGLLLVLGVSVAGAMAWYLLIGHNWNKAATQIDDLVGSMDGYTVILFEGVVKQPAKPASQKARSSSASSTSDTSPSPATSERMASVMGDARSRLSKPASLDVSSTQASSTRALPTASSSSGATSSDVSNSSAGSKALSTRQLASKTAPASVSIDDIAESYFEKGAAIVRLDIADLARYADPLIVSKGGRRYGICSAKGRYRYVTVRDKVLDMADHASDFNIVIADHKSIKRGWLSNVDMVVLTCNARIPSYGEHIGSTFFVDSPYVGEIQAVIVSPSGTVTTKTISRM